ncbi:phenylacetate--CoA ligase [Mycobacterium sp. CBMA293]|nr:phenylacetate--CoA ligase [Mycolicibacterium sp. CBMA 360]MUL57219.1 phenylacetate--CoA ligase [Mycolicibacterium sp. CBMA 335]MUL70259.1 phenylacetate--CoA ligase [Mycolicibacterium sp. CBMA 311]MUL92307.1 phenylacetate--CoA ligase [Mycolicibacterium sp. CBMA 230]MUM06728.1 phenylacetate--CoA ligase [Mycolicibacterium sp. CBMA 213]MUM12610.1 phenylacetate--CoA ligase [Mycolicibacterium sp. CBMA 293]
MDEAFFEPGIECASRAQLEDWQEKRILELVPYAFENSAFYRQLWTAAGVSPSSVTSMSDFVNKVPSFSKDDLRDFRARTGDPFAGLLCIDRSEITSVTSTSGTTGNPEPIPEVWSVAPPLPTIAMRDLWCLGLRPGDRVLIPAGSFRGYFDAAFNALGLVPVFIDGWIGEGEHLLHAIQKYDIRYLQLFLPTVLEWEKLENTYDLRAMLAPLKGASFAGMPLGRALENKVRQNWGVNLFTYTSAGDTGTAWEGVEHDGFHLWEDTVFAEARHPLTDELVGDGELGELIATDLDNVAAPYIRFRTGDLVRLNRQPAPSGRTHARMWVHGRKGDELSIAGKALMLTDIWRDVESVPELSDGMFQIVYAGPAEQLRIRLGYRPEDVADLDELKSRAAQVLKESLEVPVDAEMITADDLLLQSKSVAKFSRVVKQ